MLGFQITIDYHSNPRIEVGNGVREVMITGVDNGCYLC